MKVGTDGVLLGALAWGCNGRILDIGTGTGLCALMMAQRFPDATITGIDIDKEACLQAKDNTSVSKSITIVNTSLQDYLPEERYDAILSNPPYVMEKEKSLMRPNVLDYEPSLALFVPDDDPLPFYRAIAAWSLRHFSADGMGLTEINEQLGAETQAVFTSAGFHEVEQVKDFFDKTRFVFYKK